MGIGSIDPVANSESLLLLRRSTDFSEIVTVAAHVSSGIWYFSRTLELRVLGPLKGTRLPFMVRLRVWEHLGVPDGFTERLGVKNGVTERLPVRNGVVSFRNLTGRGDRPLCPNVALQIPMVRGILQPEELDGVALWNL